MTLSHLMALASWLMLMALPVNSYANEADRARRIWDRIVGSYRLSDEPKIQQMATLIRSDKAKEAVAIATAEGRFIDYTIARLAAPWSNRDKSPNVPYNSMIALIQGTVKDKRDFRQAFYGNYLYRVRGATPAIALNNEDHFLFLQNNNLSAAATLEYQAGQNFNANYTDYAGVFTIPTAKFLYDAGTNRRPVEWAFNVMLCKDMSQVFDTSRGDLWVGMDVDRTDIRQYTNKCIGCHGTLDSLRGAFFLINTNNNALQFLTAAPTGQQDKFNRNVVFADGHRTVNNSWENRATENQNTGLGWRGPIQGSGIAAFGRMFSESEEFGRCMAEQIFSQVCFRAPSEKEKEEILKKIAISDFEDQNYQLHKLYEAIAANEKCIAAE